MQINISLYKRNNNEKRMNSTYQEGNDKDVVG